MVAMPAAAAAPLELPCVGLQTHPTLFAMTTTDDKASPILLQKPLQVAAESLGTVTRELLVPTWASQAASNSKNDATSARMRCGLTHPERI
jgi:hypothetical protein